MHQESEDYPLKRKMFTMCSQLQRNPVWTTPSRIQQVVGRGLGHDGLSWSFMNFRFIGVVLTQSLSPLNTPWVLNVILCFEGSVPGT